MRARDGLTPEPLSDEKNRFASLVVGAAEVLSSLLIGAADWRCTWAFKGSSLGRHGRLLRTRRPGGAGLADFVATIRWLPAV